MKSEVNIPQDSKRRLAIIAAASVCIVIGLSFAAHSLVPGDPVGTKVADDSTGQTPASAAAAKPEAQTGAASTGQPGAFEPQAKPSKTGFQPLGK